MITGAEISGFSGYKGNFLTMVDTGDGAVKEISHGVAIVATGAVEYRPREFGYGENDHIMTQLELDEFMRGSSAKAAAWNRAVMIQCVGSRNEENPNCSRICCQSAVKHALQLKKLNPEMDVLILYKDMRTYGLLENFYAQARREGVLFARYDDENPPKVVTNGAGFSVLFNDHVLNRPIEMTR